MKRREFITLLGGAAAAVATWHPLAAQQAGRIYRVGFLAARPTVGSWPWAIQRSVTKCASMVSLTAGISSWNSGPRARRRPGFMRTRSDLVVASGPDVPVKAALAASRTVPIVMWANNFDPIAQGFVQTLARPGGTVTGVFTRQPELAAKQVEILKETFPDRTRLTALYDALSADQLRGAEQAAKSLQLTLRAIKLENPPYDIASAFRRVVESDRQMLIVLSSPLFGPHNKEIAEETVRSRLPAMFIFKYYVEAGGLISYGIDIKSSFRRLAEYVAKILNGATPSDLPVEQPTKFELIFNLKTAKAIGIELPTSLLLGADEVIE
jgi:putative tryptophan/tyrosine transport system substrate-binding protein